MDNQLPSDRYGDRELSWLAFNQRVLELAEDGGMPLLERVRFLSIFSSNLDEFFMVRVAGLQRRMDAGMAVVAPSGLTPRQLMDAIQTRAHELVSRQVQCFEQRIQPELAAAGITLVR
ncbi:MAG: RNA degradosome polyphosphate kinase, partial [Bifidobacteriaceae bacterium]|nr:RNA degradosome polyphosphate kinase [Bifidobacteriaceae bacterium]